MIPSLLKKKWLMHAFILLVVVLLALLLGGYISYWGIYGLDDVWQYKYSQYLLSRFGLHPEVNLELRLFGPLTELVLGICTHVLFPFIKDVFWLRHTLIFAYFPLSLGIIAIFLRKNGFLYSTIFLLLASVIGIIRLGGNAAINVKDFPIAITYLWATIAQWHIAVRIFKVRIYNVQYYAYLIALGAVSILPFLMRTPLLLHFGIMIIACIAYVYINKQLSFFNKCSIIGIPFFSGLLLIYLLFPTVWDQGLIGTMFETVDFYSDHPVKRQARIFGILFNNDDLPFWYSLAWIVVIAHPIVLLLSLIGLFLYVYKITYVRQKNLAQNFYPNFIISLQSWLMIISTLSFIIVILKNPTLYDEERHILFLYPLFYVACIMSFKYFSYKIQTGLAIVILFASMHSYINWGKYSYIYINPLLNMKNTSDFIGDYWGVCTVDAFIASEKLIPTNSKVQFKKYYIITKVLLPRLKINKNLFKDFDRSYRLKVVSEDFNYAIVSNRNAEFLRVLLNIPGDKKILWVDRNPMNEVMCAIVQFAN